jgi:hypothetical protein
LSRGITTRGVIAEEGNIREIWEGQTAGYNWSGQEHDVYLGKNECRVKKPKTALVEEERDINSDSPSQVGLYVVFWSV